MDELPSCWKEMIRSAEHSADFLLVCIGNILCIVGNSIVPRIGYVNINTINTCVENNWLLLGFEAWMDSFPTMKMTKLRERYPCPYGILYKKDHFVSK